MGHIKENQPTKWELSRLVSVCCQDVLEHLWLVVLLWSICWTLLATWTSWASVIAAWATVVITTWAASIVTTVIAWTLVASWLALRLNISLRLLDKDSA